ncbi:MAG: ATP-binding protein [Flavobacterium sp.]
MLQPKKLKHLKLFLNAGFTLLLFLAITSFLGFYTLQKQTESVKQASNKRIKSILIANELRQTSDNLTRLARNYVLTGNPIYKQHYFDVLKIRNGQIGRPTKLTPIYLDHLTGLGAKTYSKDGTPLSLIQIAKNEGINSYEVNILKRAKKLSDHLALKEEKAFNLIKGGFNKPDQEKAIALLFDKEYDLEKSEIIFSINDFYNSLNDRTQKEVTLEENTLNNIVIWMRMVFIFSIVGFIIIIYTYRKINTIATESYFRAEKYSSRLAELNDSKNKFFSIIAHDIRSPLTGFLGLTHLLSHDTEYLSREEIREFGKAMEKSALNLFELLENLLEWANLENGITEFQPEPIDLSKLTDKNIELHKDTALGKQIILENNIKGKTIVFADERMIDIVLRNLFSNAIKFTPHGGKITIGIDNSDIKPNCYVFYIEDNGLGIPENQIGELFKISRKTSNLGTDGEKGSGLGLILCKEFIEKNNGKIWVKSEANKGTTFYFSLPVA